MFAFGHARSKRALVCAHLSAVLTAAARAGQRDRCLARNRTDTCAAAAAATMAAVAPLERLCAPRTSAPMQIGATAALRRARPFDDLNLAPRGDKECPKRVASLEFAFEFASFEFASFESEFASASEFGVGFSS